MSYRDGRGGKCVLGNLALQDGEGRGENGVLIREIVVKCASRGIH